MQQYQRYIKGSTKKLSSVQNKHWLIILVTSCILFALLQYYYKSAGAENLKKEAPAIPVSVTKVQLEDIKNSINLAGLVHAYETVAIRSRIDSQIDKVNFKDGDVVKEGQLLFQLDDSLLKAEQNQYKANVKRDEAQVENSRAVYNRYKKLSDKGFLSTEKLQEANLNYKTAQATLNATKAAIDSVTTKLEFTKIVAPISGKAGTINFTRGNNVKANDEQALVTINGIKPILVQLAIQQRYYDMLNNFKNNSNKIAVTAKNSATGELIDTGSLEYIDNMVDSQTGTFKARAVFANENERMLPGMFVDTEIVIETDKAAMIIPAESVQNGQDGAFVFVVNNAGKVEKRPVQVTRTQDGKAVIQGGLTENELVVSEGFLKLKDGVLVNYQKTADEGLDNKGQ